MDDLNMTEAIALGNARELLTQEELSNLLPDERNLINLALELAKL
jgi:hypothetical protein